jgi:acyl-CoA synthetase (AMP-forming)/AMP-acid ligase II
VQFPLESTLGDALVAAAERSPDDVGWVFEDQQITRARMLAEADRFAAALLDRGIGPGDRVAVWLPNRLEWAVSLFACARIGAVLVALNTRWKSVEAGYVLEHSRPKLLVVQRRFLRIDFADLLADLGWPSGDGAASGLDVVVVGGTELRSATPWDELLSEPSTTARVHDVSELVGPGDAVLLQYTSGSTARPKGALVPHRMVLNYGAEVIQRLGVRPGEAYLSAQPLYHVAGSCLGLPAPLTHPIRVVVPEYYSVERVLQLTERERCVSRGGTSTMYLDEIAHERFADYDTSSIRSGWVGAPPAVLDSIRAEYPVEGLVNLYSASEGGGTWGDVTEPWELRRVSVGRALTGTEIHVRDVDTGRELPAGQVGEIGFRGWMQMIGYLGEPEKTAEASDADGFLHLGDLGFLDEAGYLHYTGRIKDMIRSGGENVAAEEVETFLVQHPAIRQAAVIGRPDDRMGEVVIAVVEPTSPGAVSEAEVIAYCKEHLANFRVPRAVHFVDAWPTTASGKILKPSLRERFAAAPEGVQR